MSGRLELSSWGLPAEVLAKYSSAGIDHMFEWQADCLCTGNVLDGGNLVYSAPTSAGKTMVAELLLLKRVLETQKKAIIVLPFVSVAREKMFYLQNMFGDVGIIVDGFIGGQNPTGGFSAVNIAVCTIEKANGLINRLLEEDKIGNLGMIIVDELHMVGDNHRGYLLELMLTKVKFMIKKKMLEIQETNQQNQQDESFSKGNPVQIIGMSATLPNLELLAKWLNANLYTTDFRPVPLTEMVKIGTDVFDDNFTKLRVIKPKLKCKDDDQIIQLCLETITEGCSVLIFCPSKAWCESLADTIAREFYSFLHRYSKEEQQGWHVTVDHKALSDVCEQLRRTPVGIDSLLGKTVPQGVAFHHAGLTFDERDIVEGAFRQGSLKVLVATSTLSSGVNLPARRVIIRTPTFHGGALIDSLTYKQMIGRAGRKGVDIKGESILVCKPNEHSKAEVLVRCDLPAVHSCLQKSAESGLSSSMKRAILEVIVSGVADTPTQVKAYAHSTMLAASIAMNNDNMDDFNAIECCINFLQDNEFIALVRQRETECYVATQLGSAVLSSALSPDEGLVVFQELQKARKCFVLENELHILYLVTPIYMVISQVDWWGYMSMWEKLSVDMKRVAELVGVTESFLSKAVQGNIRRTTAQQYRLYNIHLRFYTCLVLHDLINEMPLNAVCSKYKCNRGTLQSLQQSAATFAGMVTVFCHKLGWINLELLLSQFQCRLTFGVQRELVDLVRISLLNGQRSRTMFNHGYQTVASLAGADPADVEVVLKKSAPFMSRKKGESESDWEAEQRKQSHCIWLTGKKGLTEAQAALLIIEEAKQLLQRDLSEMGVQWKPQDVKQHTPKQVPRIGLKKQTIGKNQSKASQSGNLNITKTNSKKVDKNISVLSPPPSYLVKRVSQNLSDKKRLSQNKNLSILTQVKTDPVCLFNVSGELDLTCLDCESPKHKTPANKSARKRAGSVVCSGRGHRRKSPRFNKSKCNKSAVTERKSILTERNIDASQKQSSTELFRDIITDALTMTPAKRGKDDSSKKLFKDVITDEVTMIPAKRWKDQSFSAHLDTFAIDSQMDKILEQLTPVSWKPGKMQTKTVEQEEKENSISEKDIDKYNIESQDGSFLLPESVFDKASEDVFKDSLCSSAAADEGFSHMSAFEDSLLAHLEFDSPVRDKGSSQKKVNGKVSIGSEVNFSPGTLDAMNHVVNCSEYDTQFHAVDGSSSDLQRHESTNDSSVSECLPPTPELPCDEQVSRTTTPNRLIWGAGTTPKRSQRLMNKQMNSPKLATPSATVKDNTKTIKTSTPSVQRTNKPEFLSPQLDFSLQSTNQSFTIIDVCSNAELFELFIKEWKEQTHFALSIACEKLPVVSSSKAVIGDKFMKPKVPKVDDGRTLDGITVEVMNVVIVGLAVSWSNKDAYYLALTQQADLNDLESSLAQPDLDHDISLNERLTSAQSVLSNKDITIALFDSKHHCKALSLGIGVNIQCGLDDPKVADWLLDPGGREKNLHRMVNNYLQQDAHLLDGIGGGVGLGSIGLNPANPGTGRLRACIEAVLLNQLMKYFTHQLQQVDMLSVYKDIETANCRILAKMEMNGMGFDAEECCALNQVMQAKLAELEEFAYSLAGHPFSLTSSSDISQVLFLELRLPPSGDPANPGFTKKLGTTRRQTKARQQYSTAKEVLEKLQKLHPLATVILEWRRISNTLSKVVFPLMNEKKHCHSLDMFRLHGVSQTYTATGRVSMQEPNFQNIPKAFNIEVPGELNKTLPVSINMRHVFVPYPGAVILAADYSQLELRVIAHLSRDKQLIDILNSNTDVFKMIAAKWKGISVESVSTSQRQQAKQICYGMIYGIGAKALGEQLDVDQNEATMFIESFKSRFSGMKVFLRDTVKFCREKGYVETMLKRRRYLPAIKELNVHAKAHAERQSVNTTVQGSAADIVKKAMVAIDNELTTVFQYKPHRARVVRTTPRGAFFILQLHDELIYEVHEGDLTKVKHIVKHHMEHATKLSVRLPVKISVGPSWGTLKELPS